MKILKAGFSAGGLGKTIGAEKAPEKIIEFLNDTCMNEKGIAMVFQAEDIAVNQANIEDTNKNIIKAVSKNIRSKFMLLGGDHSVTFASFSAFSKLDNPGILIFDAHPDCMHNFNPPTHEDFLRVLIEENIVKKENVILAGIRSWHSSEMEFLKKNKIRFFTMEQINENIEDATDAIMSSALSFSNLYVSVDIDVVDPAFAPGTGYPEPAGLTSRQIIYMLQRIAHMRNLKAVDLVEINPEKDINNMTSKLGAKIVSEILF